MGLIIVVFSSFRLKSRSLDGIRRGARGICYAGDSKGVQTGLAPGLVRLFDGIGPVCWGMRRAYMQCMQYGMVSFAMDNCS
ncbi:MAG: hypothetical protein KGY70_20595 [Bacteroidales bacterium]|nr:hypothetical protein [Bacteroidales bacterium]